MTKRKEKESTKHETWKNHMSLSHFNTHCIRKQKHRNKYVLEQNTKHFIVLEKTTRKAVAKMGRVVSRAQVRKFSNF